jgi:hypothetical protein
MNLKRKEEKSIVIVGMELAQDPIRWRASA